MPLFGLGVWAAQSGKETYDAVLSALNAGYRHIDTAEMYGNENFHILNNKFFFIVY